jgi:hypothetical protein
VLIPSASQGPARLAVQIWHCGSPARLVVRSRHRVATS